MTSLQPPSRAPVFWSILLIVGVLAMPAAWLAWRSWRIRQIPENEMLVTEVLTVLAYAELWVQEKDLDGNGKADYWTGDVGGLAALIATYPVEKFDEPNQGCPSSNALLAAVAEADPSNPSGRPYRGYWFVPLGLDGAPYRPGGPKTHPSSFGFCAYPDRYGVTGRRTFIVNEHGTTLGSLREGAAVQNWPSDAELLKDWSWSPPR